MFERDLYSSDHEVFRDSVRKFIADKVTPFHEQWEKDGQISREAWLQAGEQGLLCATIPEEYGGPAADFLYSAVVLEELARVGAMGPGFALHSDIVAPYLLKYASEDLKQKWLPKMVTGEIIGAIAMTDPSGGSDLANLKTKAVRDGDDYVISGQKVFITNGQTADIVIVACRTSDERAKGVSLILVEADRAGFKKGRNLEKIGWKAQDTSELFFDEVRVPVSNIVGIEGNGFVQLMEQLPQERLLQGIRCASVIEAGLEWTVDYVRDRQAFGKTVASFQNTRFKLAEVHSKSTMMRVFVDRCIAMHLEGKLDANDAAMCKMLSSELMMELLDECLQLFGGYGYMWEYPIARAWADGRQSRLAGGTGEIMREIIGRELVGRG
ncbi:MAG: acyl-CoA dehydrogenase [Alphaproteobacteria bacterium]|jgi:acyl-CoA dehydrogenase|nr:acyl-CoA dehydrogenase [Alphaproteobacteria bacterium]MBT4018727.1 acyl-CoA dehydrogenase [Alphaproteobacteria bacterium]MBT5162064.1 acyl-CoA dehydrogenase [Alphaproteobacteria bacterium]MBT5918289.1 acyl-CoA dehydrogenase [Alphaproteobacteria bacterium]MBT6386780.1 acyl-CoA dehydrogenase [Alphaproteobacteria bacterium]